MPTPNSATAAARESAWLATSGDGLPSLLESAGGPFDVVQAYRPRTPRGRAGQLYVLRRAFREDRFANQRRQSHYQFELQIVWPLSNSQGSAEEDQQNLDNAVDLVLQRVGGFTGDKTHGGRFLSVAEVPRFVDVVFTDPAATIPQKAAFEAQITYFADDFEITG